VGSAEVGVLVLGAEGGDLEHLAIAPDGHGAEPVLVRGTREQRDQPVRAGVRGQVPVGRLAAQERVPERPPDDERGVAGVDEAIDERVDGRRDGRSEVDLAGTRARLTLSGGHRRA
jgi:hypothetical protein